MIKVFPAESRYVADHGWLKSNFSFSFAEYYDPNNLNFGPLRVLNDDIVKPLKGFDMHPHREMEIVSIVLEGYLQHKDSRGNTATTTFGGVQRMSAGTGILHAEVNPSSTEKVNLLQLWFLPNEERLTPSYEQTNFDVDKMKNNLLPIVSNHSAEHVAHIHQDLTIYLADLDQEKEIIFRQEQGRKIFLFVIEGNLIINQEETLKRRDSARITDIDLLKIKADADSRLMIIDLP